QAAGARGRRAGREDKLGVAPAEADERDAVAVDVRASQELRERALRLPDAVRRHAARSVHEEDVERARLRAVAFEAQVFRREAGGEARRAPSSERACGRGGPQGRVQRDGARAAALRRRARVASARGGRGAPGGGAVPRRGLRLTRLTTGLR